MPFLQVAMEVIEISAPELAVLVDITEGEALAGLLLLIKWGLARCPDELPPSANDVVLGPAADKLIARAAGHHGDPTAYVDACCSLRYAVLERVKGGVRVKGLDRYNAGWARSRPAQWAAWKKAQEAKSAATKKKNRPGTDSEPTRDRLGTDESDADADADAEKLHHHQAIEEKPVAPAQSVAPQPEAGTLEALREYLQDQRVLVGGNTREEAPSRKVRDEQQARFDDLRLSGVTGADFKAGCERYLLDPYWATRSPPHPFAGFLARWSQWAPKKPRLAMVDVPSTPAEQAWKAQLDQVGEGQPYASHTLSKGLELVGLDGEALVVRTDDPFFAVWARTYLPPEVRIESPPMPAEASTSRETMPLEANP